MHCSVRTIHTILLFILFIDMSYLKPDRPSNMTQLPPLSSYFALYSLHTLDTYSLPPPLQQTSSLISWKLTEAHTSSPRLTGWNPVRSASTHPWACSHRYITVVLITPHTAESHNMSYHITCTRSNTTTQCNIKLHCALCDNPYLTY